MAQAKSGDRVRFDYTATLEDGTVFDSTIESECDDDCGCDEGSADFQPMELTIGDEEFFPAIEQAMVGMSPGESKKVLIPPAEAFGEYDEEKVFTVERSDLPEGLKPEVGDELLLTGDDDEELEVTVVELDDSGITFDANHPLAGEELTFEITLKEIL